MRSQIEVYTPAFPCLLVVAIGAGTNVRILVYLNVSQVRECTFKLTGKYCIFPSMGI